jgi:hypothetical protein
VTNGISNFSLDIFNGTAYQHISNSGVKAAIASLAAQLMTYRSQATAVAAVGVLRDLIEDVLRGQTGQVVESIIVPAAYAELLVSDTTAQTALGTIRTYFATLSTSSVPVAPLQSKQSFVTLCRMTAESI